MNNHFTAQDIANFTGAMEADVLFIAEDCLGIDADQGFTRDEMKRTIDSLVDFIDSL